MEPTEVNELRPAETAGRPENPVNESDPQPVAAEPPADSQPEPALEPESAAGSEQEPQSDWGPEPILQEVAAEQLIAGQEQPAAEDDDVSLKAVLEAVIYVTEEPLSLAQIATAIDRPEEKVKAVLDALIEDYNRAERGISVREVAGGYKMGTKPEHHEAVRTVVKNLKPPLKLSLAALETLAVIAYKQPITSPEVMEIRGVQGTGVLKTLLDRKLITTAGRKNVIGKPILYRTTKEFLLQFGLKDLAELPTLKEFEELRRLALTDAEEAAMESAPPSAPIEGADEAALSAAAATIVEPEPQPEEPAPDEPSPDPPQSSE